MIYSTVCYVFGPNNKRDDYNKRRKKRGIEEGIGINQLVEEGHSKEGEKERKDRSIGYILI